MFRKTCLVILICLLLFSCRGKQANVAISKPMLTIRSSYTNTPFFLAGTVLEGIIKDTLICKQCLSCSTAVCKQFVGLSLCQGNLILGQMQYIIAFQYLDFKEILISIIYAQSVQLNSISFTENIKILTHTSCNPLNLRVFLCQIIPVTIWVIASESLFNIRRIITHYKVNVIGIPVE